MLDKHKIRNLMAKMRHYRDQHFRHNSGQYNWQKILLLSALAVAAFIILMVLVLATTIAIISIDLPDVHNLDNLSVAQSTTIYDRNGNVLYVKYGDENREYKKLDQISKNLVNATLAIEDDRFYQHPGFDMVGLVRAGLNDITNGQQGGGSTITQQYIKLTFLSSEKSYIRKLKELILAVRLEEAFDKDTILEKYLNKIPYGNNAYGIEKAAQIYFNKSAKELTIGESAVLAGIPQLPSYYNPYGPNKFSALASSVDTDRLSNRTINSESDLRDNEIKRGLMGTDVDVGNGHKIYIQGRADLVLRRMVDTGRITESEKDAATEEMHKIVFNQYKQSIVAPHFVFYVIQQLEAKYDKELVEQGGLKVYTTLDPNLQKFAEDAITSRSEAYEKKYNVKNAALVSLDPKTGQILAMVGSRNYFDKTIDGQTNLTTRFRQPGSSFKPFVYAAAFLNRYSPSSIVFDVPTPFGSALPKNFDGQFQGPITLRNALGQSRNIPAIKSYFLGGEQEKIIPFAESLGVEFLDDTAEFGYPLGLGTAETSLLSMADGYATFDNGGIHNTPISILRVENAQGEILEQASDQPGEQVLDPQIAYLITSVLSDRDANVGSNLDIKGQINAAKTGTSNRKDGNQYLPHDLLTIGYTTKLVTAVWAGNNDDRVDGPLNYAADGYNVAAPIFKDYMEKALAGQAPEDFPIPEGIKQETVSKYNGKLVSELTPADAQITDFFASWAVPTEIDDSYSGTADFSADESLADMPCQPGQTQQRFLAVLHDIDPTRQVWEDAAQAWLKDNLSTIADQTGKVQCQTTPTGQTPTLSINNLTDGQVVTDKTMTVQINAGSPNGISQVLYYLDGTLQYKQDISPFSGNIRLPKGGAKSNHQLTILVYDKNANIGGKTITINTSPTPSSTSSTSSTISNTTSDTSNSASPSPSQPTPPPSSTNNPANTPLSLLDKPVLPQLTSTL